MFYWTFESCLCACVFLHSLFLIRNTSDLYKEKVVVRKRGCEIMAEQYHWMIGS